MPYQPKTHVANGSRYVSILLKTAFSNVIRIMADESKMVVENADIKISKENVDGRINISRVPSSVTAGYSAVAPGDVLGISVGTYYLFGLSKGTVFLSVYYEDCGYWYPITTGLQIYANESIIITKNNTVVNTKMGELWVENHNGRNHEPK